MSAKVHNDEQLKELARYRRNIIQSSFDKILFNQKLSNLKILDKMEFYRVID